MKSIFYILIFSCVFLQLQAGSFELKSPDGHLKLRVGTDRFISYSLERDGRFLLSSPEISMTLKGGEKLGLNSKISRSQPRFVNTEILALFHRNKTVSDNYNELTIRFKGGYGVVFRAYNDGMAYRFITDRKDSLYIESETVLFDFKQDLPAWIAYSTGKKDNRFQTAFQNVYSYEKISGFNAENIAFLPSLIDMGDNLKACIIEADLEDYPGMFIGKEDSGYVYRGIFSKYPKTEIRTPTRRQQVITASEDYIARTKGKREFPWRGVVITTDDMQLPVNDLVYRLGSPSRIVDPSWIKPGKSAWDWWNDWGISGVGFKSGINNDTYKYYIDFASENGLEYVILDEGWSPPGDGDIMKVIPEIDLIMLTEYARKKKVDLVLWAVWNVLDDKLEEACKYYSSLGIKGFKIDFMDRDDQEVVNFIYRCAGMCSQYKLIIDYHGMYKPTGIQRTYPNILNFEGVFGLEELKWSNPDMPLYDVTFPFIRMLSGPVDYTQGGFRNAGKRNFRPVYNQPMTQGTRCHQLATYIVFDSPFSMLADNPTDYRKEQICTDFIAAIPPVFDSTTILDGKVGEYIVTLRQKEDRYYLGALTNWNARDLQLDLSFLPDGDYKAIVFRDGVNAGKVATDYKRQEISVRKGMKININMAEGGGWACIITK